MWTLVTWDFPRIKSLRDRCVVPPNVNAHLPTETGLPPAISWSTSQLLYILDEFCRCEKKKPTIWSIIFFQREVSGLCFFFQEFRIPPWFFARFTPIGHWRSLDFSTGPMATHGTEIGRIRASDFRPSLLCRQRGVPAAWLLPVGGASETKIPWELVVRSRRDLV